MLPSPLGHRGVQYIDGRPGLWMYHASSLKPSDAAFTGHARNVSARAGRHLSRRWTRNGHVRPPRLGEVLELHQLRRAIRDGVALAAACAAQPHGARARDRACTHPSWAAPHPPVGGRFAMPLPSLDPLVCKRNPVPAASGTRTSVNAHATRRGPTNGLVQCNHIARIARLSDINWTEVSDGKGGQLWRLIGWNALSLHLGAHVPNER